MRCLRKLFIFIGLFTVIYPVEASSLPDGTVLYEAENYFLKDGRFRIAECIHVSGTRFVEAVPKHAKSADECLLFQADFPAVYPEYTIWACVRRLDLELRSAALEPRKIRIPGREWHWVSLGRYRAKQIGSAFSIYGISADGAFADGAGLDAVIVCPDKNFVPRGVFQGYSGKEEYGAGKGAVQNLRTVEAEINTVKPGEKISEFIASANAHGIAGHIPENKEWDRLMYHFYSGNLLAPLFSAKKNTVPGEDAWNFKEIDEFISRAKTRWGVKEIMLFPQWWLKFDSGKGPTPEQLKHGSEILMQLVRRYGSKGAPHYVRYWVLSDEWACGGYWKNNYRKFASYYASQVRLVKAFNPELIVGGPVDCWPNDTITAELLRQCPELDFIAWNMFITGRGDTPLEGLFQRTSFIRRALRSSRELGRRWHKKDVPVMITSLGPNYHAWDPLDKRLAEPVIGVWHALALNYMAEENCAGGLFYNIRARDCGFFGPGDSLARLAKMQPEDVSGMLVNLRPSGRVVKFYKTYFSGKSILPVKCSGDLQNFSLVAASDEKGETMLSAVNFSESPCLLKLQMTPFKMEAYDSSRLPSRFLYCDRQTVTEGEGFFFRADGKAELWMPPYSSWSIVVVNRENPAAEKAAAEQREAYRSQAAVFHLDGDLNDAAGTGSKSLGWYGEHFSDTHFKCGTGAGDYTGNLHARARIQLKGRAAALNGSREFGIAFWIYRVKNTADYGSILSFGKGKLRIQHVGGGNPDTRFEVKDAGFCKFGGTWNHSLMIPKEEWTHVAVTADGKFGRIIVNGQTKWKFPQTGNGLNGSDILYLGSQQEDLHPIDCYIDELILSDHAAGEEWARDIYKRTKSGRNY